MAGGNRLGPQSVSVRGDGLSSDHQNQVTQIGDDDQSNYNMLVDNALNLFEVDVEELEFQQKKVKKEEKKFFKQMDITKSKRDKDIRDI